ncbi:hypothetical protein VNO77_03630 [Canavalia gladiata]|uniref:Uncharacterized protein n=1 Tax=Canavalia gladiata TaxID=3824 RepID=A0AAN9MV26_CANGL
MPLLCKSSCPFLCKLSCSCSVNLPCLCSVCHLQSHSLVRRTASYDRARGPPPLASRSRGDLSSISHLRARRRTEGQYPRPLSPTRRAGPSNFGERSVIPFTVTTITRANRTAALHPLRHEAGRNSMRPEATHAYESLLKEAGIER